MKRKYLEMIVISLIVTSCMDVIIYNHRVKDEVKSKSKDMYVTIHHQKTQNKTHRSETLSLPPNVSHCQQNIAAYNEAEFSTLPDHIKDFLLYRHCRSFPMLLDVPDKCGGPENSADVFLLLVIKSSPENYERREVLRKTWAKERFHKGVWIRRIFITGTTDTGFQKHRLNKLLRLENMENKDILQWDFKDSFYNLTLKQILFLEWMERRCPDAKFLLNGDDDIFANSFNMVEFLQGQDNDGSKHLFTGYLMEKTGPIRKASSKYYIPVQVHKSDSYPPYCSGGGFLLSGFTARTIYKMSPSIILMPIDDVYMGMCLEKADLKPTSHFAIKVAGMHIPSKKVDKFDPCYYREVILVHQFMPHMIFVMWNEIQDPHLQCAKTLITFRKSITKKQGV